MHLTEAIAQLLSKPGLRESFRTDRAEVARRLGISGGELLTFLAIDERQLTAQAETLINKRFHEVATLLPYTFRRLGAKAKVHFWEYAGSYWPNGHRRHLDDAVHFCRFLGDSVGSTGSNVNLAELNRVRFALEGRRFAVRAVSDLMVAGRPRRAVQVLYRLSGQRPRYFAICSRF